MANVEIMRYLPFFLVGAAFAADLSPQLLIEKGHFKRARPVAEQKYRANPKDPEALWLMASVKQAFHDLGGALDLAQKAVEIAPKNPRYHLLLADISGESAEKAGFIKQMTHGRRFKKEVDATLALDPDNVAALQYLMVYYLQAPGIAGGDKTKARTLPTRIMAIDPVEGCLAELGIARHDKQDRAEELLRKAVELRPQSAKAHRSLADYYLSSAGKRFEEAEKQAREAIRLDPDQIQAHNILAVTLVEERKWKELEAALAEAEKAIPDNLASYYAAAARCVWRNQEFPRAESCLRKYLTQEPEPNMPSLSAAHRLLGGALYKQGNKAAATAELQLAVKLDPNSPARNDLKNMK